MDIKDISKSTGNVDIEGKIGSMNEWMISINDKTGQTFVRYSRSYRPNGVWQKLLSNLKVGNTVRITNCEVVNYHGILQLKLRRKGEIIPMAPKKNMSCRI